MNEYSRGRLTEMTGPPQVPLDESYPVEILEGGPSSLSTALVQYGTTVKSAYNEFGYNEVRDIAKGLKIFSFSTFAAVLVLDITKFAI